MIDLSKLITAQDKRKTLLESAVDSIRAERQPIIGVLDGLQASALATGDIDSAANIEAAKQGLRDITKIDLSDCDTYDDMRTKVKLAYYSIASQASPAVVLAFRQVLQ